MVDTIGNSAGSATRDGHAQALRALSLPAMVTQPTPPTPAGIIVALLPSAAFLAVHHLAGLLPAITAASVTSAALIVIRRRQHKNVGIVLPVTLAYVLLRAAAGILTNSDDVYFGVSLATSAAVAIVVAVTAFTSTPAAARLMPAVVRYPQRVVQHPLYRRVAAHTTLAWAAAELAVTAWESTHLAATEATQFVLLRTLAGWPIMAIWICALIFYVRLRLDPLNHHLARREHAGRGSATRNATG